MYKEYKRMVEKACFLDPENTLYKSYSNFIKNPNNKIILNKDEILKIEEKGSLGKYFIEVYIQYI